MRKVWFGIGFNDLRRYIFRVQADGEYVKRQPDSCFAAPQWAVLLFDVANYLQAKALALVLRWSPDERFTAAEQGNFLAFLLAEDRRDLNAR